LIDLNHDLQQAIKIMVWIKQQKPSKQLCHFRT